MKQGRLVLALTVSAVFAVGWLAATESAPSPRPQDADQSANQAERTSLSWHSVDGSASASTGGGLSVQGTAGQPDAGVHGAAGLGLEGGFWAARAVDTLFADGFESGDTSRWSATVNARE